MGSEEVVKLEMALAQKISFETTQKNSQKMITLEMK